MKRKINSTKVEYQIGDYVFLNGLKCEVVFLNRGFAFVAPRKENSTLGLYKGCVCGKIDSLGHQIVI